MLFIHCIFDELTGLLDKRMNTLRFPGMIREKKSACGEICEISEKHRLRYSIK